MKKYISSILFLLAAMIWGFAFSAQKDAGNLPTFSVNATRSIFATVFLLCVIPLLDRFSKNGRRLLSKRGLDFSKTELIGGVICGIILASASAFQQFGLGEGTDAGKAAFITALYVLIVPILSLFVGRRAPINVWISVGVAIVGFYLLCIKDNFSLEFSDGLVLVCALIFALHIMAIDRFSPRCDGVRMSCVQFFTVFAVSLVLSLIFEGAPDFSAIGSKLPSLLFLGIGSSGIAYTLQIVGQKNGDPTVGSIIMSLESVFGVIGGAIVFGEVMTPKEYIGCLVVFIAVILSQIEFKKKGAHADDKSNAVK